MAVAANPLETFIWGAGGAKKTPEQVAREREIAAALMQGGMDYSPVDHWLQGAARAAQGLVGGLKDRWAGEAETAGMERGQSAMNPVLEALMGTGGGNATRAPATAPQTADAQALRQGLIARGLPEHVADGFLMNFQDESGLNPGINEANPTVPGSRGGYGLYQLTGPRRVAYEQFARQRGVDPSNTDAQLDFLMSELQGPEAEAAQSIMAAPDAGSAAAAIATNFLRPAPENLAPRLARYTGGGGLLQGGMVPRQETAIAGYGVQNPDGSVGGRVDNNALGYSVFDPSRAQVASLDPSIGAPAQLPSIGPTGEPPLNAAPQAANPTQDIAQALMVPPQGGATPSQGNELLPLLLAASGDPWARKQYGGVIDALMGQQVQQMDPQYQLDTQLKQAQLAKANAPAGPKYGFTWAPDGTLIRTDETSGGFDPMGQFGKPEDGLTDTQRNLAWRADQAGLKAGTPEYAEFMRSGGQSTGMALSVGPDGSIQFAQGAGAGSKPLTENQSKLTLFQSLQTQTQPVLLDLESQFNPGNLQDAAARSTPIAGNFFQSEQGQIYNSAATAWAEGALRIATGAAATPEEMERTKKAYFAQPGDTPNTIAFKAQMREMYNRAIDSSLGKPSEGQLPLPSEFAQQASKATAAPAPQQQSQPRQVNTEADYNALPSGALYLDPTGQIRTKR